MRLIKQAGNFCPAFSSKQESDLLAIANNEKSPAYARARSVLRKRDLGTWDIDIRIAPPTRSMELVEDVQSGINSLVEVHPNPASGEAFFTSKIPEGVQSARIVLTDSFGKKVWETQAEGTQIIPLNLSRFSSGVYVYSLYMDGTLTESNKLVISK